MDEFCVCFSRATCATNIMPPHASIINHHDVRRGSRNFQTGGGAVDLVRQTGWGVGILPPSAKCFGKLVKGSLCGSFYVRYACLHAAMYALSIGTQVRVQSDIVCENRHLRHLKCVKNSDLLLACHVWGCKVMSGKDSPPPPENSPVVAHIIRKLSEKYIRMSCNKCHPWIHA